MKLLPILSVAFSLAVAGYVAPTLAAHHESGEHAVAAELNTADAVWAYAITGPDGAEHSAEEVHSISLSTIQGEFAEVLKTEQILMN